MQGSPPGPTHLHAAEDAGAAVLLLLHGRGVRLEDLHSLEEKVGTGTGWAHPGLSGRQRGLQLRAAREGVAQRLQFPCQAFTMWKLPSSRRFS